MWRFHNPESVVQASKKDKRHKHQDWEYHFCFECRLWKILDHNTQRYQIQRHFHPLHLMSFTPVPAKIQTRNFILVFISILTVIHFQNQIYTHTDHKVNVNRLFNLYMINATLYNMEVYLSVCLSFCEDWPRKLYYM